VTDLQNVWICAQDLQLIRADRVISVLVPVATGYGAAAPSDLRLHKAIYAEIDGGTEGDTITRVKLADCGSTPAGVLLTGLAQAVGSARAIVAAQDSCVFIYAEHDTAGYTRWTSASKLPEVWPQSTPADGTAALTRSPLA
jgi:hypothetical protein